MLPELVSPKQPIALRTEHVVNATTTFRVQQHGKGLSSGKFTVFQPNCGDATAGDNTGKKGTSSKEPQALMSIDGKYMSSDEKRCFRDASGLPLFDVYHSTKGYTWYIDLPGSTGVPIGCIKPQESSLKDSLDVEIKNAAANGDEVTLHVRGQDIWKQRTNVYLGDDQVVMTSKRTDKLATYLPGKKVEWDVTIAAGMDMSLASVIIIIMAAQMYNSSMAGSLA